MPIPPIPDTAALSPVFSGEAMWEIEISLQLKTFLWAFLSGVLFCLVYDIFRARRKTGADNSRLIFFEDIIFFFAAGVYSFLFLLVFSCGQIRLYALAGQAVGFFACRITVSKLWLKILVLLFSGLRRLSSLLGCAGKHFESFFNSEIDKIPLFLKKSRKK